MSSFVLSIFDVSSIQEYIFASNRLRENIAASFLVEQASGAWFHQALPLTHNLQADATVGDSPALEALNDQEAMQRVAEVIYRGGGSLVVLFRSNAQAAALEYASACAQHLSERVLKYAPGLTLDVVHLPFDWSQVLGGSQGLYMSARRQLEEAKLHRRPALGSVGLGVTLTCRSTGLPAMGWDPDEPTRPVSAVVRAKLDNVLRSDTDQRLIDVLGMSPEECQSYTFSRDLDELGRTRGDMSYIAVVHADANGIGRRLRAITVDYTQPDQNRAFLNHLRIFSRALEQSGRIALRATKETLLDLVQRPVTPGEPRAILIQSLTYTDDHLLNLPFRPLVFGGDDTTFVCDGRLGLTLAEVYLRAFDAAAAQQFAQHSVLGDAPHACAGVAIVNTHYPFARAYALCEELCKNSKRFVDTLGVDQAALDWYIADTGIHGALEIIRPRQYMVPKGRFYTRPVLINGAWPSWASFLKQVTEFQYAPEWRERHNKVVALYDALRQDQAQAFRTAYAVQKLPEISDLTAQAQNGAPSYRDTGWATHQLVFNEQTHTCNAESVCVYSDALEALEFMLPDSPYAELLATEEATP